MGKKLNSVHFIVFTLFFAALMVIAVQLIVLRWTNCIWIFEPIKWQYISCTFPIISILVCLYVDLLYFNFLRNKTKQKSIVHGASLVFSVVEMILFLLYGATIGPQGYFDITDFIVMLSLLHLLLCVIYYVVVLVKRLIKPAKA